MSALLVLLVADAVIVGLLVGVLHSPALGIGLGVVALAMPIFVIPPLIAVINSITGWSRLARTYPAQPPAEGCARGLAPSVGLRWRWFNYNMCVRWAADERFLHLSIVPPFGKWSRGMSIPWEEIDFDEGKWPRFGKVRLETAAGIPVFVPREVAEGERARRLAGEQA